jgi:hypothetical protein
MRILEGPSPQAVRERERRRVLRRTALRMRAALAGTTCYPIDRLHELDPRVALGFRPRLTAAARLAGDTLVHPPYVIALDPFEVALLRRADGKTALGDLVAVAKREAVAPADPVARATRLVAALARYELIERAG